MGSIEMKTAASSLKTIPEFFAGRSIFITGASGFLGKVLVEKLLYSCPDIDTIYLLVRPKRCSHLYQRIQEITNSQLFDRVRKEHPNAVSKLHPIGGDVSKINLGMSSEDRKLLQDRVSVVFHLAATVRFDTPLTEAVLMNVRGTREIAHLATEMKNLEVLIHTSTTYCNSQDKVIEEKLYEAPADWKDMIQLAESEDHFTIRQITSKIVGCRPNTYTFTKALAEHVINDYREQIPVAIVRPSIVIPATSEPMPGWGDSFNGPMGLFAGAGKGILHTYYFDQRTIFDVIPVDTACKSLIAASWYSAQNRSNDTLIYNSTFSGMEAFGLKNMIDTCCDMVLDVSVDNALYAVVVKYTENIALFYLMFALFQIIPAGLLDFLLWSTGRKTRLLKLNRRIFTASLTLKYFVFNRWTILNNRFLDLEQLLLPEDKVNFSYQFSVKSDTKKYLADFMLGGRRYLFKEEDKDLPSALKHQRRMQWLHFFLQSIFYGSTLWIFYSYSVPQKLFSTLFSIVRALLIL